MSNELDDLLKELKNPNKENGLPPPLKEDTIVLKDDNVGEYVLKKAAELIETGLFTVEAMRNIIATSYETDGVESYAALIKAVNDSIETLNKINIQNKKSKTSKEIKQMELDGRQQLPYTQNNTNVLIATRDEVMKNLISAINAEKDDKNTIDVTAED